jgi:hypothetical protein
VRAVLGYGLSREWHYGSAPASSGSRTGQWRSESYHDSRPASGSRQGQTLRSAIVRLDYLSLPAFASGRVQRSAWNAPIDGFLPLVRGTWDTQPFWQAAHAWLCV